LGGGVKGTVARFSLNRREKITNRAIEQTGKDLGIFLKKHTKTNIVVVNERTWKNLGHGKHAAAFYKESEDTLYIRRKYFAKRGLEVEIHERLHARSGNHVYRSPVSQMLEEGTVDWLTDYTKKNSFRTKGTKFGRETGTGYITETSFVTNIMTIIGREKYLGYWQRGMLNKTGGEINVHNIQKDLKDAGYWKTANNVGKYWDKGLQDRSFQTHKINKDLNDEIKERKGKNWSLTQHVDIITYEKKVRSQFTAKARKEDEKYRKSHLFL